MMKKLLASILALALLFGLMIPAAADDPEPPAAAVTHIEAKWNGKWVFDSSGNMKFTNENVTVTRHFDDGTSDEAVWNDSDPRKAGIKIDHDRQAGKVTVTYQTEHQASFDFPVNYYELLVNDHPPSAALVLNKAAETQNGDCIVYTFTPEKSGEYRFESDGLVNIIVLNKNFELLDRYTNSDGGKDYASAKLQPGETYFVVAIARQSGKTVTAKRPSVFRRAGEVILPFVIMPMGLVAGATGLMLPLAIFLPITLPASAVLSVLLSPITALAGFIVFLIQEFRG